MTTDRRSTLALIAFLVPLSQAGAQEIVQTLTSNASGQPQMSGLSYTLDAAFDPVVQVSTKGGSYELKTGFIGQLTDPRSIEVTVPDAGEGGSTEADATATLDDGTTTSVPNDEVSWEAILGPIVSISPTGVARTGIVIEDSAAEVRGTWLEVSGTGQFTVLNTDDDNVAPVAGDGIDDAWQFLYFDADDDGALAGDEAASAQPGSDPDGDDQDNLFEFLAGYAPDDPDSFLDIRITDISEGTITIELSKVVASTLYTLVGSEDLGTGGPWSTVGTVSGVDQEDFQFFHPSEVRHFYKLLLERAP